MTDSVKKFKAEMEQRGLFRKIKVAVNLIPPLPVFPRLTGSLYTRAPLNLLF